MTNIVAPDSPARRILILSLVAFAIIGGLVVLYFATNSTTTTNTSTPMPVNGVFKRIYMDSSAVRLTKAIAVQDKICGVWATTEGLFVQNWTQINLIKIDTNGSVLTTFGRKGHAPGEFSSIGGVYIAPNVVSIVDATNLTLTEFDGTGRLLQSVNLTKGIIEGIKIAEQTYLLESAGNGTATTEQYEIVRIGDTTKRLLTIPRLIASQQNPAGFIMELSGLYKHRFGMPVLRVYSYTGQFAVFDTTGHLLYHTTTIDKNPLPKVMVRGEGTNQMVLPMSRNINLDADCDGTYIYILSNAPSPDIKLIKPGTNQQGVVDIYKLSDGSYVKSIKLPIPDASTDPLLQKTSPLTISIHNKSLYVVQGTFVLRYAIDVEKIAS